MSHDQPTHLHVYRHNAKAAVRNGFAVKSLSRRGEPPAAAIAGGWAASVEWIQADAMEPGTYEHELHGVRTSTCTCTCTSAKCGGYAFPCCVCVCVKSGARACTWSLVSLHLQLSISISNL